MIFNCEEETIFRKSQKSPGAVIKPQMTSEAAVNLLSRLYGLRCLVLSGKKYLEASESYKDLVERIWSQVTFFGIKASERMITEHVCA